MLFCKILDIYDTSTKFDGVRYVMSFLDPKYPNPTRIRYGSEILRVFYGYFNYRPEPIWTRKEPNRKFLNTY